MKLEDLYYYAEDSPSGLRWKVDRYTGRKYKRLMAQKGGIAGTMDSNKNYWTVKYNNRAIVAHRVIWEIMCGKIPTGMQIDHINGDNCNNLLSNLRCVKPVLNTRNIKLKKNNSTGVTGVNYSCILRGNSYSCCFRAYYCELSGKQVFKSFSIQKYGHEQAFQLACQWREQKIAELNEQGAGYSERHGK